MDPVVMAVGTAVVGAMATDAWQQARSVVGRWWRKARPGEDGAQEAQQVEAELERVRPQIVGARERADADTEQALVGAWRLRLQQLVDADPQAGEELRQLLEEVTGLLPDQERGQVRQVVINAQSHGSSRQYNAGRDITLHEGPAQP